jgi:hypothetical protein
MAITPNFGTRMLLEPSYRHFLKIAYQAVTQRSYLEAPQIDVKKLMSKNTALFYPIIFAATLSSLSILSIS